jgi:hypothetical protein
MLVCLEALWQSLGIIENVLIQPAVRSAFTSCKLGQRVMSRAGLLCEHNRFFLVPKSIFRTVLPSLKSRTNGEFSRATVRVPIARRCVFHRRVGRGHRKLGMRNMLIRTRCSSKRKNHLIWGRAAQSGIAWRWVASCFTSLHQKGSA